MNWLDTYVQISLYNFTCKVYVGNTLLQVTYFLELSMCRKQESSFLYACNLTHYNNFVNTFVIIIIKLLLNYYFIALDFHIPS